MTLNVNQDTSTIYPASSTDVLTIGATTALVLPSGTVAQRPSSAAGSIRWNSDNTWLEYYNGSIWVNLSNDVLSITGTANEITASAATGNVTLSIPDTFVAPGSLQYTTKFGYSVQFISATGTTQADAAAITSTYIDIESGALDGGIILPTPSFLGETYIIVNDAGNQVYVYPHVGSSLCDGPINAPAFLIKGGTQSYIWDGDTWDCEISSLSAGNSGITIGTTAGNYIITNTGVTAFSTGSTGLLANGSTAFQTGNITLTGALSISNGGTGQTSKSAAFDALSPTNVTGDLIYYNGTNNARFAIGANTSVLSVTGGNLAWVAQASLNAGSATIATTANNIAGGTAGSIFYQSAANTTTTLAIGSTDQVLTVINNVPTWTSVTTALGYTPVNKAGDTMSGNLNVGGNYVTNLANPLVSTDAANKFYVDSIVTGLVWQQPIQTTNVQSDTETAPGSPEIGDAFIIPTGGNTGAWLTFSVGDLVQYQVTGWVKLKALAIGDRIGIEFDGGAGTGSFTGHTADIATVTGGTPGAWTYSFAAPVNNWAVYVENANDARLGFSYTYSTSLSQWVQFAGTISYTAGTGLTLVGTQFNNAGVLSVAGGTGISANVSTGSVSITNTGVTGITAGPGVSVSGSTGNVTISALTRNTVAVATTYNVAVTDFSVFANAASAGFTVSLPASPVAGELHNIKKVDQTRNAVVINGNGHNIDKYTTITVQVPFTSMHLQWNSDASVWQIL